MNAVALAPETSATTKPWEKKGSYTDADMLAFAYREHGDDAIPDLPIPPLLLVRRIPEIHEDGGNFGKGFSDAEYDIDPAHPFFAWHFPRRPIMPGFIGVEFAWQLAGFHLTWLGGRGLGMATGVGEVILRGQILPIAKRLHARFDVKLRRVSTKLSAIEGDVSISCDGKPVYEIKAAKVKIAGTNT
jgi:3-hydroxyacyl-[acyl-carrier protein] dehydratase / trans-2-decenoyl-[acyl-carrier protein] isomerase